MSELKRIIMELFPMWQLFIIDDFCLTEVKCKKCCLTLAFDK